MVLKFINFPGFGLKVLMMNIIAFSYSIESPIRLNMYPRIELEFLFRLAMEPNCVIRKLVSIALCFQPFTHEIENQINSELARLGSISDVDYKY